MRVKVLVTSVLSMLLVVLSFSAVQGQAQHEHGAPPAPAVEKEQEGDTFRLCSPEHMQMMLANPEDKQCVAEQALQDEATAEIIMDKIMLDSTLRSKMMGKMHAQMQKRMMEHREMMQEQGGMMQGERGMMHGERMKDTMRDKGLMQEDRRSQESEKGAR